MRCERCGKESREYELFDYCAVCGKNLCPECMDVGCCDNAPAYSGLNIDLEDGE